MGYEGIRVNGVPFESVVIDKEDVEGSLAKFPIELRVRAEQAIAEFALSAWRTYKATVPSGFCDQRGYHGLYVRFEYSIESFRPCRAIFKVIRVFFGRPPEPEREFPQLLFLIDKGKRVIDGGFNHFRSSVSRHPSKWGAATAMLIALTIVPSYSDIFNSRVPIRDNSHIRVAPGHKRAGSASSLALSLPAEKLYLMPNSELPNIESIPSDGPDLQEFESNPMPIESMPSMGPVIGTVLVMGNTRIDTNYIKSIVDTAPYAEVTFDQIREDATKISKLYLGYGMTVQVGSFVNVDPTGEVSVIFDIDELPHEPYRTTPTSGQDAFHAPPS